MCNSYRTQPKRGADKGIAKRVADAAERLKSDLVRKSDPGVVMRTDGPGGGDALGIPPELQSVDQQRALRQTGIRHVGGSVSRMTLRDPDVALL